MCGKYFRVFSYDGTRRIRSKGKNEQHLGFFSPWRINPKYKHMNSDLIIGFLVVLAVVYTLYRYFYKGSTMEGLENNETAGSSVNGLAGSASNYAAAINTMATKIQDRLLITKYRTDYENVVLSYDNLINAKMLETLVTTNASNPDENLAKLSSLQSAKMALNSVLKYIDSQ